MKNEESTFPELKSTAADAAARSYTPYSGFRVGAAVLGENGRIYSGCNVENASFGLTQCAERAALTSAVREGARPGSLVLLVLSVDIPAVLKLGIPLGIIRPSIFGGVGLGFQTQCEVSGEDCGDVFKGSDLPFTPSGFT